MNIEKAQWTADGNAVRMTMPLQKVDEEKRIVSGFATLDSVDTSGDIVLASASVSAFENFRGNIRLMHQPTPAGKLVSFRQEEYYDTREGKFYNGIYVDVYVSKGAPLVWEMVLDGTLTGFSIGGAITEQENQFVKDAGKTIRFIKAYDLVELSLVDSPANQLCNIFSVQKAANGDQTVTGMIAEVQTENVFFCANDEIAFTSSDEAKACNVCGTEAKNIGWFESDGGDKTEKVNAIVADFTKATETVEGRENDMADEVVETPEVEEEAPEVTEEVAPEEETPAEVPAPLEEEVAVDEEATDTPEVEVEVPVVEKAETPDFTQMFADLSDSITKSLDAGREETTAELAKVHDKLAEIDAVAAKIEELGAKTAELAEKFSTIDSQLDSVEKRFYEISKSVGVKKSGDLGGSTEDKLEKSSKSIWGGRFYGSVDSI